METFAERVMCFISNLEFRGSLPKDVQLMNPFKDKNVLELNRLFFKKYYSDQNKRIMLLGINPGRFGAGITGICFTDPVRLKKECGIDNTFPKKQELSSVFFYEMLNKYGGAEKFYSKFYVSAVSPLGFMKNGVNMNYYDDRNLKEKLSSFIEDSIKKQLDFGIDRNVCFSVGKGENFKFLNELNSHHHFFDKIIPLGHPRWIMQYRLKNKGEHINEYITKLNDASDS
jgi:hypothetical protein